MTSYTDEQVLDQATWLVGARLRDKTVFSMPIDMGLSTSEKMLRSLLADRHRLQAVADNLVQAIRDDQEACANSYPGWTTSPRLVEAIDSARAKKGDI